MDAAHTAWTVSAAVLAVGLLAGAVSRAFLARRLAGYTRRTATDIDDLLFPVAQRHLPLWFILAALVVAAHIAPIPSRPAELVTRLAAAAFILSLTIATAGVAATLGGRMLAREAGGAASTSLVQHVVRVTVLILGGLLVLSNLGISITPLITALGVGSLAVALALQPTLSNLFAGIHISLSRPIRVGDFVELETGVKGFVEDIGWRAIRIRELPDNVIVVPNSRVADMIVTNYALPLPEQAALVQASVAYGSDLEQVERVTCDVARDVLRTIPGGVPGFEPFIRFHTFGDSSINFTVILRVRGFTDRYLVIHEFMKRLQQRYAREGIEIPFPQRVVHEIPAGGARPGDARLARDGAGR